MKDNEVYFAHFRNQPEEGVKEKGALTIAYMVEKSGLKYSLSFCSPRDCFSKKKGRLISAGRLKKEKTVSFEILKDENPRDVVVSLVNNELENPVGRDVPRWARGIQLGGKYCSITEKDK